MPSEQPTVSDIFRQAVQMRRENPDLSLRDLKIRLMREYKGRPFPPMDTLTIPEQDSRAPEEDWTAGLSLVRRGIQMSDWNEVMNGIMLSLEQTEVYERDRGRPGTADEWHDRSVGIRGQTEKGVNKWMPAELMQLAEKSTKK